MVVALINPRYKIHLNVVFVKFHVLKVQLLGYWQSERFRYITWSQHTKIQWRMTPHLLVLNISQL